jgi:MerR HTH family regulatory protein
MSRVLRIAEVCRELGRSPDCIRDWVRRGILSATRTPSGQLQFDPRDVQAIKRGDLAPPVVEEPGAEDIPRVAESQPEARRPRWEEMAPWDQEIHQARASVEVERFNTELERLRAERSGAQEAANRAKAEEAGARTERERLTRLKQHARTYSWIPTEIEPRVTAEIERFVTSEQVPAWLPEQQQTQIVMNHVRALVAAWSQEQTAKMLAKIDDQREKRRQEEAKSREEWQRTIQKLAEDRKVQEEAQALAAEEKRAAERARRRAERESM